MCWLLAWFCSRIRSIPAFKPLIRARIVSYVAVEDPMEFKPPIDISLGDFSSVFRISIARSHEPAARCSAIQPSLSRDLRYGL